jgi:carbonic anhydrase
LLQVSDEANYAYDEIVEHLPVVVLPHSEAHLARQLPLELLLPAEKSQYFTYNGSLTTPPCSEVVTWIDYKQSIPLSHDQVEEFRRLQNTEGDYMTHNNRPVQPIGDRIVLFNEIENYDYSSVGTIALHLATLLFSVLAISFV